MSNPEERACSRPDGPNCQFLSSAQNWWCMNRECSRECGYGHANVDCSYYKPVGQTQGTKIDFWLGMMFGAMFGGSIVLIIFTIFGAS